MGPPRKPTAIQATTNETPFARELSGLLFLFTEINDQIKVEVYYDDINRLVSRPAGQLILGPQIWPG